MMLGSRQTAFASQRSARKLRLRVSSVAAPESPAKLQRPDKTGRYGKFGGKYVPETLIPALAELETAYQEARADPAFQVQRCRFGRDIKNDADV
jgi:hypothetical protein